MVLYLNTPLHVRAPLGLEMWKMHRPPYLVQKFNLFYLEMGANKDRTLDHLVIEAVILYYELSLPKA